MRWDVRREVLRLATPKVQELVKFQSICLGRKSYKASSEVSCDFRWQIYTFLPFLFFGLASSRIQDVGIFRHSSTLFQGEESAQLEAP
jgi:hypothetical protein